MGNIKKTSTVQTCHYDSGLVETIIDCVSIWQAL